MMRWLGRDAVATVGIFVFALSMCLYYQSHAIVDTPIRADASQYLKLALNLVNHGVLSMTDPGAAIIKPDSYRPPGYPVFLALLLRLTHGDVYHLVGWYWSVLTSQAVLAAATVSMVFLIGRRFLHYGWALAASLLLGVWPLSIVQSGYVLTETFFGFLLVLALWLSCVALDRGSLRWYGMAALAFAAAALVNPMIAPFPLLLSAALFVGKRRKEALVLALVVALPLVGWQIRNAALPRNTVSEGNRLVENVLIGMSPDIKRYYTDRTSPEAKAVFDHFNADQSVYDRDPYAFYRMIFERIASRPGHYLMWYLVHKPGDVWYWPIVQGAGGIYVYPNIRSPYETNAFFRLTALACITLSTAWILLACVGGSVGLMQAAQYRRWVRIGWSQFVVAGAFWYFSLFYLALTPDGRYVTPFRGVEFLLTMAGLSWLLSVRKQLAGGHQSIDKEAVPGVRAQENAQ
jgi:4-amino-4-deoxy-L-arabinose transferase-like glycosyltransferase